MAHACNTSTQGSNSQGHPQLHIVFQASLGYMTVCLKKERKKRKKRNRHERSVISVLKFYPGKTDNKQEMTSII